MSLYRIPFTMLAAAVLFGASAFAQSCDQTLWQHVYNPSRLVVQQNCVTVTGTFVDSTANESKHEKDGVRHEEDGDTHGWLKLDPGQEKFLNDGNRSAQNGNLVFEIVCKYSVKQPDAKKACQNFKGAIKLPPLGSHVAVTGTWVLDTEHEKWFEIHPVTSIVVTK